MLAEISESMPDVTAFESKAAGPAWGPLYVVWALYPHSPHTQGALPVFFDPHDLQISTLQNPRRHLFGADMAQLYDVDNKKRTNSSLTLYIRCVQPGDVRPVVIEANDVVVFPKRFTAFDDFLSLSAYSIRDALYETTVQPSLSFMPGVPNPPPFQRTFVCNTHHTSNGARHDCVQWNAPGTRLWVP